MTTFSRKTCVALTWSGDGTCRGVLLKGQGSRCVVVRARSVEPSEHESVAAGLGRAAAELGAGENTIIAVGGPGSAAAFVDLDMPELKAEELRNALSFELRKRAPLPPEKLVWGYRRLPDSPEGGSRVRLYFLRQNVWNTWVDDISGIDSGVDLLLPPPVALDPFLADADASFPEGDKGKAFLYRREGSGRREAIPLPSGDVAAFGCGPQPLASAAVQAGPLARFSAAEQAAYAGAIALGACALATDAVREPGLIPVPYEFRPRRNRVSRSLAAALLVYVIVVAAIGLGREYGARMDYLSVLRSSTASLKEETGELTGTGAQEEQEYRAALAEEMKEALAYMNRPSMAAALLDITRTVDETGWCLQFDWRDGSVTFSLKETTEQPNLERDLELSPVLGDVMQLSKSVAADGVVIRKIQANARYDLEGETTRPPSPGGASGTGPPIPPPAPGDDVPEGIEGEEG